MGAENGVKMAGMGENGIKMSGNEEKMRGKSAGNVKKSLGRGILGTDV